MNQTLKEMVEKNQPKIPTLKTKDKGLYQFGLLLLAGVVSENFLDLAVLPDHKYDTDGLFYTIPYLHDDMLWHNGKTRNLLVVWKIENRSAFCPLRIDVDIVDEENYSINVFDQLGQRTIKRILFSKEKEAYFTEIEKYDQVSLSQLVNE